VRKETAFSALGVLRREEAEFVYGCETIVDDRLKLIGRPDGFDLAAHAPIEIKYRLAVKPMDRLELAFYWMLLGRLRTARDVEPYGWADLLAGVNLIRVKLTPSHFAKVRALIDDVRRAREYGVAPRPCTCTVCSTRPEVAEVIARGLDIGLVAGVKTSRAETLRRAGIADVADLVAADPTELAQRIASTQGSRLSAKTIAEAQQHALALRDRRPVWLSDERLDSDYFITFDLEYISGLGRLGFETVSEEIFLIGALIRRAGKARIFQALCTRFGDLPRGLRKLAELFAANGDLPIYTWNGEACDFRYLDRAARKHRLRARLAVHARHVDLLKFARRVVRFPTVRRDLKSVARFLGEPMNEPIADGFGAVSLYLQMRSARGSERQTLRQRFWTTTVTTYLRSRAWQTSCGPGRL
jgi:predicted RecB family nuclease